MNNQDVLSNHKQNHTQNLIQNLIIHTQNLIQNLIIHTQNHTQNLIIHTQNHIQNQNPTQNQKPILNHMQNHTKLFIITHRQDHHTIHNHMLNLTQNQNLISRCNQLIRCNQFLISYNQFLIRCNQFIINNLLNIIKDWCILQPQYTGSWSGWFHHIHLKGFHTPPTQPNTSLEGQEDSLFHFPTLCSLSNF